MKYPNVANYIDGKLVSEDSNLLDVCNPQTGEIISQVPLCSENSVNQAVSAASKAFNQWSGLPVKERAQVFYKYRQLLEKNIRDLATLVSEENGKTISEAEAEVLKSIEVTEFACSIPQLVFGEILEVSKGVECRSEYTPLGVVASITPFNFPNMVPNWTLPNALVLGNTMILKPSEQTPLSAMRLADLLKEAGLPDGVFNIVHGGQDVVESICDNPVIQAVSFVGSTKVAKIVYRRSTNKLKRTLALGGAKNHLIVLPDANPEMTASNVAVSMSGCAGQRCMAASVMIAVGNVDHIIRKLCEEAKNIIPGKNLGSVISESARSRIESYIREAERQGAEILLDGRGAVIPGNEKGFYVGPTIIDQVTPDMKIAREEVFGPVLSIIRTSTVDEAIEIENNSEYGNDCCSVYPVWWSCPVCIRAFKCRNDWCQYRSTSPKRTIFIWRLE